ncbi:hypothetical protein [Candidatus Lokiarchaeum ossiferum]|uniref:hypothetical protein n=1 Tax=Candidatus Lokiarchaeum ossiferum TaxID=2951803 RepID=UPI00352C0032
MSKFSVKQMALFSPVIGSVVFLILTSIAMITFSGGNGSNINFPGYSFLYNFFSDLGMEVGYTGASNMVSSTLFLFATSICGVCMIPYFLTIPSIFSKNEVDRKLLITGSFLGIVAALGYIGIGFAPWDKSDLIYDIHMIFIYIAFPSSFLVIICYVIVFLRLEKFPKILSYTYIVLGLILVGFINLLIFGPSTDTETGRLIQVVGQKITIYVEIITFMIQGYFTPKFFKNQLISSTQVRI